MLLCTVRNCHLPLARGERSVVCPQGHSFDIARRGYINLLQPQDRRSKHPGDTAAAVAARRRLHDRGVTAPLFHAIHDMVAPSAIDVVLDAGCGEGYYLAGFRNPHGDMGHGIDISVPAIEAAAKRYPACEWVVANADRFVPYAGKSFSVVLSITGRMNPPEFRRVLRDDGRLLVALAAPDDLIELRGKGKDRVARTVADFSPGFQLAAQHRVTTMADLPQAGVEDALVSIYRPLHAEPLEAMRVTFSLDLLLFRPA